MFTVYVVDQQTTPNSKPFPIAMFATPFDCDSFMESLESDIYSIREVKCDCWPFDIEESS
jgi:hypothetical protein